MKRIYKGLGGKVLFSTYHVFPKLHEHLLDVLGEEVKATEALLLEGYAHHPTISSGSPASSVPYPFTKDSGFSPNQIIQKWKALKLSKACPDFAFREPHKVVGEAKYFREGNADSALVSGIYETAFYRGLPSRRLDNGDVRVWDYEFGLLLAYDASSKQELVENWRSIPQKVKNAFWDSANLFVAVLPLAPK